jgi:hypothetical protein
MGLFRHPHLVRGIVHTSEGAFLIERGVAELPDDVGAALGWTPMDAEADALIGTQAAGPETPPDAARNHAGAL